MAKNEKKGRPFLEVFALALQEDYRFPILEVFAFLYAFGTFILAYSFFQTSTGVMSERIAYSMTTTLMGLPLFVFIILIFKNVAFGIGNDLEKGTIQTMFAYPLKRASILTAKLLSGVLIALLVFLVTQIGALYLLAPDIVSSYLGVVLLSYVANVGYALFLTALLLLLTLKTRRGGLAVVFGLIMYFAIGIVQGVVTVIEYFGGVSWPNQILAVINPAIALERYYIYSTVPTMDLTLWVPTFNEVLMYVSGCYVVTTVLFLIDYVYFCRRLNL
jgi:ABC-type transport system involved in multi-copper enzyme maturation permease subunit